MVSFLFRNLHPLLVSCFDILSEFLAFHYFNFYMCFSMKRNAKRSLEYDAELLDSLFISCRLFFGFSPVQILKS